MLTSKSDVPSLVDQRSTFRFDLRDVKMIGRHGQRIASAGRIRSYFREQRRPGFDARAFANNHEQSQLRPASPFIVAVVFRERDRLLVPANGCVEMAINCLNTAENRPARSPLSAGQFWRA